MTRPDIRIGVGGWTFEPWRDNFYPGDLAQKRELEYASRQLTSIEINGTYYGSQKPASFSKWHDETPDDFIFALKGPRFTTNRRVLSEARDSIHRFLDSGILNLKAKLGPINWQFMATKKFDAGDFEGFLSLLPHEIDGNRLRHAVEVRHDSFKSPDFVALARKHQIAIVLAADSEFPQIADITAPFTYVRLMGTSEAEPAGYSPAAIKDWAGRLKQLAAGKIPEGVETVVPTTDAGPREVFLYVISGFKPRNPAAAMALIAALST